MSTCPIPSFQSESRFTSKDQLFRRLSSAKVRNQIYYDLKYDALWFAIIPWDRGKPGSFRYPELKHIVNQYRRKRESAQSAGEIRTLDPVSCPVESANALSARQLTPVASSQILWWHGSLRKNAEGISRGVLG